MGMQLVWFKIEDFPCTAFGNMDHQPLLPMRMRRLAQIQTSEPWPSPPELQRGNPTLLEGRSQAWPRVGVHTKLGALGARSVSMTLLEGTLPQKSPRTRGCVGMADFEGTSRPMMTDLLAQMSPTRRRRKKLGTLRASAKEEAARLTSNQRRAGSPSAAALDAVNNAPPTDHAAAPSVVSQRRPQQLPSRDEALSGSAIAEPQQVPRRSPLLKNLCNLTVNAAEWTAGIECAIVEQIDAHEYQSKWWFDEDADMQDYEWGQDLASPVYFRRWRDQYQYQLFKDVVLLKHLHARVKSITECRASMSGYAVVGVNPVLHHAFLLIELDDGYSLCAEKYNDKLQIMFGLWSVIQDFARKYRACGDRRQQCSAQEPHVFEGTNTVCTLEQILRWLELVRYQQYDLFRKNCKKFAAALIRHCKCPEKRLDAKVIEPDAVRATVELNGRALAHTPEGSNGQREIVEAAVRQNGHALQYADVKLQDDKAIVLTAVSNRGTAIYYASKRLQQDGEVQRTAVRQNPLLANLDVGSLRGDKVILADIKAGHSSALRSASKHLQCDRQFVWNVLEDTPSAVRHLPNDLRDDVCFISRLVEVAPAVLAYVSPDVRAFVKVFGRTVREAVRDPARLQSAPNEITGNRDVMLEAISQDASALEHASAQLKADNDLVLAAVSQDVSAMKHAAAELKSDRHFVLAAVKRNGIALKYAASELQSDRDLVLAASFSGRQASVRSRSSPCARHWNPSKFAAEPPSDCGS